MDLYHPGARLCVELDGSVHAKTKGRDGRRDRALATMGIKTLRFPNGDVLRKPAEFTARVVREIAARVDVRNVGAGNLLEVVEVMQARADENLTRN